MAGTDGRVQQTSQSAGAHTARQIGEQISHRNYKGEQRQGIEDVSVYVRVSTTSATFQHFPPTNTPNTRTHTNKHTTTNSTHKALKLTNSWMRISLLTSTSAWS